MESVIFKNGVRFYRYLKHLFLNSALFTIIKTIFNFFAVLTQNSLLVNWLTHTDTIDQSGQNSLTGDVLNFGLSQKLNTILKNSALLRILLSEAVMPKFAFLLIVLYPFLPTSLSIVFVIAVSTLLIVYRLVNNTARRDTIVLQMLILSFFAVLFQSVFFNEVSSNGLTIFVIYGSILLFTNFLIGFINRPEKIVLLVHALAASTLMVSVYGIYQRIIGVPVDPAWLDENVGSNITRIYSVFGNPNVFGEFLVLTLPLLFAGFNVFKKWSIKLIYMAIFALGFINVFLTFSRGSMVSLVMALALIVCFKDRKYMPLFVIGIFISPFFLSEALLMRILSVFTGGDSSTAYRVSIYSASIDMLKDHLFTGVGLGNFKELYKVYSYTAAKSYHAHNTLLMFIIEQGLLGLIFFITMLIYWGRKILSVQNKSSDMSYFAFASLTSILGCLAQSMVDHIFHNYSILFFFFVIISIGVGAALQATGDSHE